MDRGLSLTICVFFAFLTLSGIRADAIGISPGRIEVGFEPGFNYRYNFYVRGSDRAMDIHVYTKISEECGLGEYINPTINKLRLSPGEIVYFDVGVSLPQEMPEPGKHDCRVIAEEIPPEGVGGVAAYSAVSTQIWIWVPYPQKYIEATLSAPNVNLSERVPFTVTLESRGLENVTAGGTIKVTDSDSRNLATLTTSPVFVESLGSGLLTAEWDTTGVPAGRYSATATVDYGSDAPAVSTAGFKIGDMLVRINNITYPEHIYPKDIAKIYLTLDSFWNDEIDGVYVNLEVRKDGTTLANSRSESFVINAWSSETVPIFWDTEDLGEGTYDAIFTVHYSGRTTSVQDSVRIESILDPYNMILSIVAIVAVAMAILLYRRRKRKKAVIKGETSF